MGSRMGLTMCSKNISFTPGFWVGLPQNLGFDFSVRGTALLHCLHLQREGKISGEKTVLQRLQSNTNHYAVLRLPKSCYSLDLQ